jgi:hypothetical protein
MTRRRQVSTEVKTIVYSRMHVEKSLRLAARFEAAHSSFPYSSRLMWKLSPVVRVLGGIVNHFWD